MFGGLSLDGWGDGDVGISLRKKGQNWELDSLLALLGKV